MKTQTSTLPILLQHARKRADQAPGQTVGVPTGTIYSHTCPCDASGTPLSSEMLVLVKLTGGPMVMGSVAATHGDHLRIGSRVRMILDEANAEDQPASHRHRFEQVLAPAGVSVNRLAPANV